ncbi:MAG: dicarboxylate/amino acid:cation symporter [Promicromonosporaceae bacterium]|nr:dicarboxylate/amino acid:cation symporter [Promicromonosporaceae bacterium]
MKLLKSLPFRLLLAMVLGVAVGLIANEATINVVQSVRHLSAQVIFFAVPLIILGFVAPAISRMGRRASRLLGLSVTVGYLSAVGAAALAALVAYLVIPNLSLPQAGADLRALPEMIFELNIPPILPTMSALALALVIGLGVASTRARQLTDGLEEFHRIVLGLVRKVVIPVLPVFIAAVFAQLAFRGLLTEQLPIFALAVVAIIVIQLAWIVVLYLAVTPYSRRSPWQIVRHYGAPYLTAIGTQSSAATLGVAHEAASASKVLDRKAVDFGVPLLAHMHMPGSTIAITFLALTVSQVITGSLPGLGTIALFVALLGVFAVSAPGVPGGTLMASLGLIGAVLGLDDVATGLMLAIFALQDSFGTATNIAADGPLLGLLTRWRLSRRPGDDSPTEAPELVEPERQLVGSTA